MDTTFNPSFFATQITEEQFNKACETALKLKEFVSERQKELSVEIYAGLEKKLDSAGKLQFSVPVYCYLKSEFTREELSGYFLVKKWIELLLKAETGFLFLDELRDKMKLAFDDYESRLIVYECSSPVMKHSELEDPIQDKDWHEYEIEINEPDGLLNLPLSWKIKKGYFSPEANIYFKFKDVWIEFSKVWI